jgi:hypothetical protein
VHGVISNPNFSLKTSAKTIPASVLSEHKNQVDTFMRNFMKVTDSEVPSPKQPKTTVQGGYASEDDHRIKFGN